MIAALAMLFTARLLQPAPGGVGTHEQLGLPPCPLFHFTGLPCPTCGFTTCFAHAARGHFYRALIVQPFGLLVFDLMIASVPISLLLAIRRIAWSELIRARHAWIVGYTLLILLILGWIYKIIAVKWLLPPG
ncbi:MAG: DUF2752 domain-containing protein [Blastocatellia bacterium]